MLKIFIERFRGHHFLVTGMKLRMWPAWGFLFFFLCLSCSPFRLCFYYSIRSTSNGHIYRYSMHFLLLSLFQPVHCLLFFSISLSKPLLITLLMLSVQSLKKKKRPSSLFRSYSLHYKQHLSWVFFISALFSLTIILLIAPAIAIFYFCPFSLTIKLYYSKYLSWLFFLLSFSLSLLYYL